METLVLPVAFDATNDAPLARAAAVLRSGRLVAFPTETVYGLGANALDAAAVSRIFAAKGRPAGNPLIVHAASVEQARALAADFPESARVLAARFWPGPLTLIVPRAKVIADLVTAGGETVGLRVPAHPIALALLRTAQIPLAAPSANQSAHLSPTRAEHVLRDLAGRIDLLLDAGPTSGGIESTVLDVSVTPPRLLRPGLITPAQIEAIIGPILQGAGRENGTGPLRSPGLLARHYAPRTPLELAGRDLARVAELRGQGLRVGWLTISASDLASDPGIVTQRLPGEPVAYSAGLYAALHTLDQANVDRIVVALPPAGEEWLAVHDRLRRAAMLE